MDESKKKEELEIKYLSPNEEDLKGIVNFPGGIEKVDIVNITKLPTTWKETYLIKLSKSLNDLQPMDAIGILPFNSKDKVDDILKITGWSNSLISVSKNSKFYFNGYLEDLLINYIDISTMPKKLFLKELLNYSTNKQISRIWLDELIKEEKDWWKDGKIYKKMIKKYWYNLYDLIVDFKCKIPLEKFLLYCEFNKPRYYTLINGQNEEMCCIVGLLENNEILNKYGYFSGYVKEKYHNNEKTDDKSINILEKRKNNLSFYLNSKNDKIFILFCTGTGVATAMSVISSNVYQKVILIYGFRNKEDNILEYLMPDILLNDKIKIFNCLSSINEYVTDDKNIAMIDEYINCNNLKIIICGNSRMQRDMFLKIKERYKASSLTLGEKILFDSWL